MFFHHTHCRTHTHTCTCVCRPLNARILGVNSFAAARNAHKHTCAKTHQTDTGAVRLSRIYVRQFRHTFHAGPSVPRFFANRLANVMDYVVFGDAWTDCGWERQNANGMVRVRNDDESCFFFGGMLRTILRRAYRSVNARGCLAKHMCGKLKCLKDSEARNGMTVWLRTIRTGWAFLYIVLNGIYSTSNRFCIYKECELVTAVFLKIWGFILEKW